MFTEYYGSDDCQSCQSLCLIFGIDDKDIKEETGKNELNVLRIFGKTYRTLFLPNKCQRKILPILCSVIVLLCLGFFATEYSRS